MTWQAVDAGKEKAALKGLEGALATLLTSLQKAKSTKSGGPAGTRHAVTVFVWMPGPQLLARLNLVPVLLPIALVLVYRALTDAAGLVAWCFWLHLMGLTAFLGMCCCLRGSSFRWRQAPWWQW